MHYDSREVIMNSTILRYEALRLDQNECMRGYTTEWGRAREREREREEEEKVQVRQTVSILYSESVFFAATNSSMIDGHACHFHQHPPRRDREARTPSAS
jgi:hypothetical protein